MRGRRVQKTSSEKRNGNEEPDDRENAENRCGQRENERRGGLAAGLRGLRRAQQADAAEDQADDAGPAGADAQNAQDLAGFGVLLVGLFVHQLFQAFVFLRHGFGHAGDERLELRAFFRLMNVQVMEAILAGIPDIDVDMGGRFAHLVAQDNGNALQLVLFPVGRYVRHTGVVGGEIGLAGQDLVILEADGNDPQPGSVKRKRISVICSARGAAVMLYVFVVRIGHGVARFARKNARDGVLQPLHICAGLRELFVLRFLQVRPNNTDGNDTHDDEPSVIGKILYTLHVFSTPSYFFGFAASRRVP